VLGSALAYTLYIIAINKSILKEKILWKSY
jgi:hypothetical protein